jgi:hypothetical protein
MRYRAEKSMSYAPLQLSIDLSSWGQCRGERVSVRHSLAQVQKPLSPTPVGRATHLQRCYVRSMAAHLRKSSMTGISTEGFTTGSLRITSLDFATSDVQSLSFLALIFTSEASCRSWAY